MVIFFSSGKQQRILDDERLLRKHYGKLADKIMIRLAELEAALSLEDIPSVPPPRRHKLIGSKLDLWGVDVSKNYRIVLEPQGQWDRADLSTVREVKILDIEDYH
ncbi:MAG: type II toxin-antitoxin system RelE/ParE family toxin [Sphaerochaetaceae bacterium]